jgi:magnesium chelatase family protein
VGYGENGDEGGKDPGSFADGDAAWDLRLVRGQNKAKRALELAAAGQHHLLLLGPPGSGKSLLAHCLQSILPPMKREEMLEVNRIYSAAGLLDPETPWIRRRPFRNPHAGVTKAGLLGGGIPFRPGEVSLAHRGVLFIDELPEMDRNCLESLRQPLEDGRITLSRVWGSVTLPAKIQLVASANPCPCGFFGEYPPKCKCLDREIRRYQNRFSGPLIDRIDMVVHVPRLSAENLTGDGCDSEDSRTVSARVGRVWQQRQEADKGHARDTESLNRQLTRQSKNWAVSAYENHRMTARGYYRMLLLARTIADLNGEDVISVPSLAEALEYRLGLEADAG